MTTSKRTQLLILLALVASAFAVPRFDLDVSPQATVDGTKAQLEPYSAQAHGQSALEEAQAAADYAMKAGKSELESHYPPYRKQGSDRPESHMHNTAHTLNGHEHRRHHARIAASKRQDAVPQEPQAITVDIFPFATTAVFHATAGATAPATAEPTTVSHDDQSDLADAGIFGSLDEEHEKGEKSHKHKMIAVALTVTVIGIILLLAAIKVIRIARRKRSAARAAEQWRESFVNSLVEEKQAQAAETRSEVSLASTRSFKTAQSDMLTTITRIPTPPEQQPFMDMTIRTNFLPITFARALSPPRSHTPPAAPLPEPPKHKVPEHYAQLLQPLPKSILKSRPSSPPKTESSIGSSTTQHESPHKRARSAPGDFLSLGAVAAATATATVAGSVGDDGYWEMLDMIGRPDSNHTTRLSRSSSQTSKARSSRSKSEIFRRISGIA
ncbi:hypothetical protein PENSPDRAFT_102338 [Peniophora sp. CONT]|nr:hypothetical protein PENSPDRAFT_102338 [Peniophora sp. CONT]